MENETHPPNILESAEARYQTAMDVRRKVLAASREHHASKALFAKVLTECYDQEYWAHDYKSFREYAETEVGIGIRAAQQLVKTWKACEVHGITEQEMAKIGWSKLAIAAPFMTADNLETLLMTVKNSNCTQLKAAFRQKPESDEQNSGEPAQLKITDVIGQAMQLAAKLHHTATDQECLEAVARHFVLSARHGSRTSRRFDWN